MTEQTAEEAAQIVNSKRNFSINPTMAEETAEESAQRVNAKRLAAKERKTAQLDENPPGQRESKSRTKREAPPLTRCWCAFQLGASRHPNS